MPVVASAQDQRAYLAPFLAHGDAHQEPEPPRHSLDDVEVSLPFEWHEEPRALDPYSSHASTDLATVGASTGGAEGEQAINETTSYRS